MDCISYKASTDYSFQYSRAEERAYSEAKATSAVHTHVQGESQTLPCPRVKQWAKPPGVCSDILSSQNELIVVEWNMWSDVWLVNGIRREVVDIL